MTNHYRTTVYLMIALLVFAFVVASLDTNDLDEICSTDGLLKRSTTWGCQPYGEFNNITLNQSYINCTIAEEGKLIYNSTSKLLQLCNGTGLRDI